MAKLYMMIMMIDMGEFFSFTSESTARQSPVMELEIVPPTGGLEIGQTLLLFNFCDINISKYFRQSVQFCPCFTSLLVFGLGRGLHHALEQKEEITAGEFCKGNSNNKNLGPGRVTSQSHR